MRSTAVAFALLALAVPPVGAAVLTVTKTADTLDGACDPYDCSLREAVAAANQAAGTDVIELPPGTYVLTRTGAGEDGNETGDLDVNDPLILIGADPATTVLDGNAGNAGNAADRVLDVRAATEIFGVTVRNGQVSGPGGGALARKTILDYPFVVRRSVISGNRALGLNGSGGGVKSETGGGGIYVIESTVSGNRADVNGGGIYTDRWMAVLDSTVSGNSAGLSGGGLHYPLQWYAWVAGTTVTHNQAGQDGGGVYAVPLAFPTGVEAQLLGSIVAGNTAPAHPDCVNAHSAGYNVIGVNEGCVLSSGDRYGSKAAPLDPKLAELAGIGGPTPVHALLPGSPALDLVPAGSCFPYDQLGRTRSAACEAGAVEQPAQPVCVPGGPVLCLHDGRFRVTASWASPDGSNGPAIAAPLTDDTGNFWFFSARNLELTVKVLDGCDLNDRFWVFSSGLTDRAVDLRVEDLWSGEVWSHRHPSGATYAPKLDTSALAVCHLPPPPGAPAETGTLEMIPASAVLEVTKGLDTLDGRCDHDDCSLREAVSAANARPGVQVILLGDRVHALSRAGQGEDGNTTGDLDAKGPLVILGSGAGRTAIDGGAVDRILHAPDFGSPLEIHGVTLRNGDARSSNFSGGDGGAVLANSLTLVASHVTGNRSAASGGGIHSSSLVIRDSTVSDNQAVFFGGGIETRTLSLANVTVSGNRVEHFGGGMVFIDHQIDGATVTGNSAGWQGGGIFITGPDCPSDGTVCEAVGSIRHSIIAGNQAPQNRDCVGMESPQSGYNVFGVDEEFGCAAGATDLAGTPASPLDPKLTPLGDHSGPTPTHSLLADSPAVDLGDLGPAAGCLPVDQRGRTRPADGDLDGAALCDAGAVERLPACQPDATTLCLGAGDRFRVTAHWTAQGEEGEAHPIPLTLDTGSFWFFNAANVELTLKVLDGCAVNDRFWVFVSGLTNVRVDILVEDFVTGKAWTYSNPAGATFQPRLDTNAFDICQVNP